MKWISVEKEKPPIGKVCLLYITYPEGTRFNCRAYPLQITFYRLGGLRWNDQYISYEDQYLEEGLKYVSHWMPLPEPPKE